jgi:small-conductance mechanosensitive channel
MLIGIMVALSSIGLDFSNVAWIAGALSVGIGFGLQSIVNNFVSGLIIMFERSLKVGDFLELQSGVTGTVSQINMRSTIIRTPDNLEIVVPNSEFISGRVVNWTLTDNDRRLRIPFSVEYGTDKELVVRLVMQAARNVPYTLEDENHEPQVWMTRMGDNGLEFELLVWVRQGVDIEVRRAESRQGLRAAYLWEIESALREAGIGMPFPQRDYYIRSILGQNSVEGFVQALNTLKPTSTAAQQEKQS